MKMVGTQYNYYEAAVKFFQPGVLNEFAQALLFKWETFNLYCNQDDKTKAAMNFYSQIVTMHLKDDKDLKLWSSEPHAHQIVFLELLAMGPVIIGIQPV